MRFFCVEQEWGFWCSLNVSYIKREAECEMKSLMDNNWEDNEDLEQMITLTSEC